MNNAVVKLQSKPVFRTMLFFIIILCCAATLIMLGRRNDAATLAQVYKAGVLTADEVNVAFEKVSGRLVKRLVNENDRVHQGDTLMLIDDRDYRLDLAATNAQIANMEAQIANMEMSIEITTAQVNTSEQTTWRQIEQQQALLDGAKAALTEATANYRRYSELVRTNAVSKSNYDTALSTYEQSLAQATELKKQLAALTLGALPEELQRLEHEKTAQGMHLTAIETSRAEITNMGNSLNALRASRQQLLVQKEQQEINLKRTVLTAPQDGRVLEVNYEEGEMIPASSPAVLLETDRKYVDIYISEYDVVNFLPGTKIEVRAVALDRPVTGTIRYVNAAPSFADLRMTREQGQGDLTSYEMRVYVDPQPDLLSGMTMELVVK